MAGMLISYDEDGNVLATCDYQNVYDPDTLDPIGETDYLYAEGHGVPNSPTFGTVETFDIILDKKTGKERFVLRDSQPCKGSKVWPECLGGRAIEFRVELAGPPGNKRIAALVHKQSGHRRERAEIEAKIMARIEEAHGKPADIRDLVGGPDRPLKLDEDGKTKPRPQPTPIPPWVVRPEKPKKPKE